MFRTWSGTSKKAWMAWIQCVYSHWGSTPSPWEDRWGLSCRLLRTWNSRFSLTLGHLLEGRWTVNQSRALFTHVISQRDVSSQLPIAYILTFLHSYIFIIYILYQSTLSTTSLLWIPSTEPLLSAGEISKIISQAISKWSKETSHLHMFHPHSIRVTFCKSTHLLLLRWSSGKKVVDSLDRPWYKRERERSRSRRCYAGVSFLPH